MSSPKCTAEDSSSDTPQFHNHYCDPSDDTVLRSEDGVLFRTSSFKLAKASTMFAGMFSTARPKVESNTEVIDVACDSETLEAFLDIICQSPTIRTLRSEAFSTTTFPVLANLRRLAEYYDVTEWLLVLEEAMEAVYDEDPLAALSHAGKTVDVAIAKRALESINGSFVQTMYPIDFWGVLDELPASWQLHLIRLLLVSKVIAEQRRDPHLVLERDWSVIADKFNPPSSSGSIP